MTKSMGRFFLVHLLPFLHLLACLIVTAGRIETGWQTMLLVDFPMSAIVVAIIYNFDHPLLLYGTLGTLWWYLISRIIEMIWVRVFAKRLSRTSA